MTRRGGDLVIQSAGCFGGHNHLGVRPLMPRGTHAAAAKAKRLSQCQSQGGVMPAKDKANGKLAMPSKVDRVTKPATKGPLWPMRAANT